VVEVKGNGFLGDNEIITRIGARDEAAEKDLLDKHGGFIFALARKQGLSEADAEEVTNDVLLEAIEQARSEHLKASTLRPWLRKVTKNRVIDRYRRNETVRQHDHAVVEELCLAVDCSGPGNEENEKLYTYKLVVRQALQDLRKREAKRAGPRPEASDVQILVWIAHGATNEELAEYLGTNENAARQRRHRALQRLKKEMSRPQEEMQAEMNDFVEDL
jgi:RNA polymerase sigma factor (sigma-70 family)